MAEAITLEEQTIVVKEAWSTGRLIDELFLELDNVKDIDENNGLTKVKCEERAKWLMYSIPTYRPVPAFIINLSDISTRIKEAIPISPTRFTGSVATMVHSKVVDIELW